MNNFKVDNMDIIKECLDKYGLTINSVSELPGGWLNSKYLLQSDSKQLVLKEISSKKFPKDYIQKNIYNTLLLENDLVSINISCPKIFESSDGLMSVFENGERFFLMEYMDGEQKDYHSISLIEIENLGVATGKMHQRMSTHDSGILASDFLKLKTPSELEQDLILRRKEITQFTPQQFVDDTDRHLKIIYEVKKSYLIEQLQLQIIHGDYTLDNIIFKDGIPQIIDFELARVNSRLQDVGRILLSTAFDGTTFDLDRIETFAKGYIQHMSLTDDDIVKSLKVVWVNEVDIWIKERYYRNYNPPKVQRFMQEINWITENWFELDNIVKRGNENERKTRVKKI